MTQSHKPKAMAELLKSAGYDKIKLKDITADIAEGAPTNPDGTMDIMSYGAWLAQRVI